MRLTDQRPATISGVVGQRPATSVLERLAAKPHKACLLLEGPPGTGKTTSAYALANDLGCKDDYSGCYTVIGADLSVDYARELFTRTLRFYPMEGKGWRVLVIEELDRLRNSLTSPRTLPSPP